MHVSHCVCMCEVSNNDKGKRTVCLVFPANVTLSVHTYLVYQETQVTETVDVSCHLL